MSKNNVSYFEAGYKLGLRFCGFTEAEIRDMFEKDLEFVNKVKEGMRAYDTKDNVQEAEREMFDTVEVKLGEL